MFPFASSHVRHGRQFVKDARKLVAYKRDLVSESTVTEVEGEIKKLEEALKTKDQRTVEEQMQRLDTMCGQMTRPVTDATWRENVEVIFVAIVIALAVRTYFLQPFTIPTGSMQPTLNGILAYPGPPPGPLTRVIHKVLSFRTYFSAVAQADETLISCEEVKRWRFFTATRLETDKGNVYYLSAPMKTVLETFDLPAGRSFKKGETIVQGYMDTGDHVFVDKMSYHFVRPKRDQVFVFSTQGIQRLNPVGQPSQYYIKRLVGLPGDELRIAAPTLYINGQVPTETGLQRVMTGQRSSPATGYRGYASGADVLGTYLTSPTETFTVEKERYMAMGDNSYNSSDSRVWGTVPQENIAGRALLVYYPFASHFGWIW